MALRHIFGSNEESWAVHCEGWSRGLFESLLGALEYEFVAVEHNAWRGTHNIDITARRTAVNLPYELARARVRDHLADFLVDQDGERDLLHLWMTQYDAQLGITCGTATTLPSPHA